MNDLLDCPLLMKQLIDFKVFSYQLTMESRRFDDNLCLFVFFLQWAVREQIRLGGRGLFDGGAASHAQRQPAGPHESWAEEEALSLERTQRNGHPRPQSALPRQIHVDVHHRTPLEYRCHNYSRPYFTLSPLYLTRSRPGEVHLPSFGD